MVAWIAILSIFLPLVSTTGALVALYATTSPRDPAARGNDGAPRSQRQRGRGAARGRRPGPHPLLADAGVVARGGGGGRGRGFLPTRRYRQDGPGPGDVAEPHQWVAEPGWFDDHAAIREERADGAGAIGVAQGAEAILAVKLEDTISKHEILRGYLNTVYFGHGAYGVQAAARTYFDRDAKDLTLLQSATLAGLDLGTVGARSFEHPEEALLARDFALTRMTEVGSIGPERAELLRSRPSASPRKPACARRRHTSWSTCDWT